MHFFCSIPHQQIPLNVTHWAFNCPFEMFCIVPCADIFPLTLNFYFCNSTHDFFGLKPLSLNWKKTILQHFSFSHSPSGQFGVVYIDHQLFFTFLKELRETLSSTVCLITLTTLTDTTTKWQGPYMVHCRVRSDWFRSQPKRGRQTETLLSLFPFFLHNFHILSSPPLLPPWQLPPEIEAADTGRRCEKRGAEATGNK